MKAKFRSVLIWWSIQFLGTWVIINLFTVIPYIYFVNRQGNYLFHEDKSPVTAWEYFLQHNFRYEMLVIPLFHLFAELNYQYIFKKLGWALFIGSCFIISSVSFTILAIHHPNTLKVFGLLASAEPIILMAAYAFGYAIIREYLYQLKHKKDVQLQQSQSELNSLKAQLNPHFLFNSLNYLYGTALNEKAYQTAEGIDQLSEMLRYTVTGMHETFVPIEKEISFVENYVAIQKARLPEANAIRLDMLLHEVDYKLNIAPMLLLTFIENAFKHGISTNHSCYVYINKDVTGDCLKMETRNLIINPSAEMKSSNNTGIKNTIKRLELLYPQRYTIDISKTDNEYKSLLSLKLSASNK